MNKLNLKSIMAAFAILFIVPFTSMTAQTGSDSINPIYIWAANKVDSIIRNTPQTKVQSEPEPATFESIFESLTTCEKIAYILICILCSWILLKFALIPLLKDMFEWPDCD